MEVSTAGSRPAADPWLTVITVVFNDADALASTVDSLDAHEWPDGVEHIVVDGSTDPSAAAYTRSLAREGRTCVVEPDAGIYDAMNKGLDRATGRRVLFLNAGDRLSPGFDEQALRAAAEVLPDGVVIGYCIERFGDDRYLNPGRSREARATGSPQHQATVYPRAFYASDRYEVEFGVSADGRYTKRAIARFGAVFAFTPIAEFALGGTSSTYDSFGRLVSRMRESGRHRWLRLSAKYLMWRLVPRRLFYRLLASYKYTRITDPAMVGRLAAPPRILAESGGTQPA